MSVFIGRRQKWVLRTDWRHIKVKIDSFNSTQHDFKILHVPFKFIKTTLMEICLT